MPNKFKVTISNKDYTKHVPFPIKWQDALDETLDYSRITLKQMDEPIFAPFTPIKISMTDTKGNVKELEQFVSTDSASETPVGSGKYNHEMYQIEQTKLLEGIVVDALTFTNDLGRNYTKNATRIDVETETKSVVEFDYINRSLVSDIATSSTPKLVDKSFTFPSLFDMFFPYTDSSNPGHGWKRETFTICYNGGEIYNYTSVYEEGMAIGGPGSFLNKDSFTVNTLKEGMYDVKYKLNLHYGLNSNQMYTKVQFSFMVAKNYEALPKWNITSVVNRILNLAEPHLQGEEPRFHLNSTQAEEFSKIDAFDFIDTPEFMLPSGTLKEDLDIIGGYIHGIPRLNGNEISFDMLDGTEQAELYKQNYPYVTNTFTQDIESYCSSLDSTVDNFVCSIDSEQGTITEPYNNGYKTMRTETVYARIEADNMFIPTTYPIQEIKSVKCGFVPGQNFKGRDITDYIFEESEYIRLNSYTGRYPKSKAYALYYTQGAKNIYGLNFKLPDGWSDALQSYAINNILKQTTGKKIDSLGTDYPLLAFQVSYIPIFRARVQQTKQYIGDITQPRTLCYNQSSNLVETQYYGEHLKGVVARMGTVDRIMMFNLNDFSLIPKLGQMWGEDYFISEVVCELYPEFLKCQIGLSKDFNRLSQYIGINSVKRFYEVSEKQAYARDMKYSDYVVIGDAVEEDTTLISMEPIKQIFYTNVSGSSPDGIFMPAVSHVIAESVTDMGEQAGDAKKVLLPVISASLGTSMFFTFGYEDNYSAGAQSNYESEEEAKGYFTNGVAYGDYYGRFDGLQFAMYTQRNEPATQTEQNKIGNKLPEWTGDTQSGAVISTPPGNGLKVDKNGAEVLSLTYSVEFVTNRKNYIIGSALARNCPLVRGRKLNKLAKLYVLPKRISKFAALVDLSGATVIYDYSLLIAPTPGKSIKLPNILSETSGEAWVVAYDTGEILFGANEPVKEGHMIEMPYLTLKHNIFNI